jgi:predicted nucleotidyltransferase component of viral defense system
LFALVSSASDSRHIPPDFVEKDFWVTEVLRATVAAAQANDSTAIFKGGTSLYKAFNLLERFSEDVDVLLVLPDRLGSEGRHKILKRICASVATHLGVAEDAPRSETGIRRSVRYPYPRRFDSAAVQEGVLLEMGVRGGPDPHDRVSLRSIVAQQALAQGYSENEFEEFSLLQVEVLARERTLAEKLALLHHLTSQFPENQASNVLRRSGRHYYDLYQLLGDGATQQAIHEKGLVARLAADVVAQSRKYSLPYTERPAAGYASSPAFDPDNACQAVVRPAYADVERLIYGRYPSLEECIGRIQSSAGLL